MSILPVCTVKDITKSSAALLELSPAKVGSFAYDEKFPQYPILVASRPQYTAVASNGEISTFHDEIGHLNGQFEHGST